MENRIKTFWEIRLADLKKALEGNNFEVFLTNDAEGAKKIILEDIIPHTDAKSVSWGGSMTFTETGLYEALKNHPDLQVVDTFDKSVSREKLMERRNRALAVDLFITGTNAVTETGNLVNLDMIGNRIAALTFGPKNVIVLVGRNKIVPDLDDAMYRIKNFTAPVNAMRLDKKTPCVQTSYCEDCKSPDRICNTWTITEKSFPRGRVKIILINENLGI